MDNVKDFRPPLLPPQEVKLKPLPNPRSENVRWIIEQFGGAASVASLLGISTQAVYRWRDHIPSERIIDLLHYSQVMGLHVRLEHLDTRFSAESIVEFRQMPNLKYNRV